MSEKKQIFFDYEFTFLGLKPETKKSFEGIVKELGANSYSNHKKSFYMLMDYAFFKKIPTDYPCYNIQYIADSIDANKALDIKKYLFKSCQTDTARSEKNSESEPLCYFAKYLLHTNYCFEYYFNNVMCTSCVECSLQNKNNALKSPERSKENSVERLSSPSANSPKINKMELSSSPIGRTKKFKTNSLSTDDSLYYLKTFNAKNKKAFLQNEIIIDLSSSLDSDSSDSSLENENNVAEASSGRSKDDLGEKFDRPSTSSTKKNQRESSSSPPVRTKKFKTNSLPMDDDLDSSATSSSVIFEDEIKKDISLENKNKVAEASSGQSKDDLEERFDGPSTSSTKKNQRESSSPTVRTKKIKTNILPIEDLLIDWSSTLDSSSSDDKDEKDSSSSSSSVILVGDDKKDSSSSIRIKNESNEGTSKADNDEDYKGDFAWKEQIPEKDLCKKERCEFGEKAHERHGMFNKLYYSKYEKLFILKYLIHHNCIDDAKGLLVWKDMLEKGYMRHRSVQSLNNNFRKVILRDIEEFNLPFFYYQKFLILRSGENNKNNKKVNKPVGKKE